MNPAGKKPTSGAWIFVSHSNKDIEKIREIRNELEGRGHNPVLFFLKCMENTEADDQLLWQLIEREIKAREWFILCDSPNARSSGAVMREMELVKSMVREGKVIETIDLSQDLQTELYKLVRLSKRATVFLSYAHSDLDMATRIGDVLRKHDYCVWTEGQLESGAVWAEEIDRVIDEAVAVQHGFVLLLLSEASLQSRFCRHETLRALERVAVSGRSNVVPVVVNQFDRSALPLELRPIQCFDLTTGPFDERVEALIRSLKTREME